MIILTISFLLLLSSLLPLSNSSSWKIRVLDFPRLHFLSIGVIALGIHLYLFEENLINWTSLLFLLTAIGVDLYRIFTYLPITNKESIGANVNGLQNTSGFSILTSNVRAKNKKFQKILDLINRKKPDIVVLIEANEIWHDQTEKLKENYPYFHLHPRENTYGILFYSKYEILSSKISFLVDNKVPSLEVTINLNNERLHIFCLHPRPPRPKEGPSIERDAELMKTVKRIRERENALVIGDLNDVAWSHTTRLFLRTSGLLDPRRGRGFFNTFPANLPFLGFPLDHIFHSQSLFVEKFKPQKNIGSDHLPFFAEFKMRTDLAYLQSPTQSASEEDFEEVKELIEKAKKWNGPKNNVHWAD